MADANEIGTRNVFMQFTIELIVGHVEPGEQAVPQGAMKIGGSVQVDAEVYKSYLGDKAEYLGLQLKRSLTNLPADMLEQIKKLADDAVESDGPSRIIKPGMDPNAMKAASNILKSVK